MVSLEVHNSILVIDVGCYSGECACAASGSFARKGSSVLLFWVYPGEGAVNQDAMEISLLLINAHGCGLKDVLFSGIISKDNEAVK